MGNTIRACKIVIGFLIGFLEKTTIIYFVLYASRDGSLLENIARAVILSLIIDIVAWPTMWLVNRMKQNKEHVTA